MLYKGLREESLIFNGIIHIQIHIWHTLIKLNSTWVPVDYINKIMHMVLTLNLFFKHPKHMKNNGIKKVWCNNIYQMVWIYTII